jgi:hypothetical protein
LVEIIFASTLHKHRYGSLMLERKHTGMYLHILFRIAKVPVRCNGFKIKIDHLGLKFSFSIVLEICGLTNFSSLTCPTTQQSRQKSIANINKRNTSSSIYFFALSIGSMFSMETINSFNNITLKILSAI